MIKYFPLDTTQVSNMYLEIANTIKQYYPRGLNSFDPDYNKYPGIIKAQEIIYENIGIPDKNQGHMQKNGMHFLKLY